MSEQGVEYRASHEQLRIVMDLCRDELRIKQLRKEAKTWEAKVTLLTLEEVLKSWRNSRCYNRSQKSRHY